MVLALALAAFGATVVISHPGLQRFRLEVLATSVPLVREEEATDGTARCFCTTRRSLHELFGAPVFLAGGDRGSASIYA